MVTRIHKKNSIAFLLAVVFSGIMAQSLSAEPDGTHTFGQRINNDRLLFRVNNPFGNEGFFSFKFGGPYSGPDITCVEIYVKDIFNQTGAYISSGGIGEKSIVVVLAVLHKRTFSYEALMYGV